MNDTSYGGGGGDRRPYGGGGFRSEVGKEYNVTITETSRRGDGVAKIDGFVIFVVGGQRGEQARIKITQVGPRFANGEKIEASEEPKTETAETETTTTTTESTTESTKTES